jgi:hypothetical protein
MHAVNYILLSRKIKSKLDFCPKIKHKNQRTFFLPSVAVCALAYMPLPGGRTSLSRLPPLQLLLCSPLHPPPQPGTCDPSNRTFVLPPIGDAATGAENIGLLIGSLTVGPAAIATAALCCINFCCLIATVETTNRQRYLPFAYERFSLKVIVKRLILQKTNLKYSQIIKHLLCISPQNAHE